MIKQSPHRKCQKMMFLDFVDMFLDSKLLDRKIGVRSRNKQNIYSIWINFELLFYFLSAKLRISILIIHNMHTLALKIFFTALDIVRIGAVEYHIELVISISCFELFKKIRDKVGAIEIVGPKFGDFCSRKLLTCPQKRIRKLQRNPITKQKTSLQKRTMIIHIATIFQSSRQKLRLIRMDRKIRCLEIKVIKFFLEFELKA